MKRFIWIASRIGEALCVLAGVYVLVAIAVAMFTGGLIDVQGDAFYDGEPFLP